MFNVYFDDSGTAPGQRIAVAAAIIIPRRRINLIENEWQNLCKKFGINDFHTSECVHKNSKSQFANWDDEQVGKFIQRVRDVTKKYAVRAISCAITKKDFDEEMPEQWRNFIGNDHYAWAFRHVIRIIQRMDIESDYDQPLEYFFDWSDGNTKAAIEKAMGDQELLFPGKYERHYRFDKRKEVSGLQCVDLLAWSCYNAARFSFEGTPINGVAEETIKDFRRFRGGSWLFAMANTKEALRSSIRRYLTTLNQSNV